MRGLDGEEFGLVVKERVQVHDGDDGMRTGGFRIFVAMLGKRFPLSDYRGHAGINHGYVRGDTRDIDIIFQTHGERSKQFRSAVSVQRPMGSVTTIDPATGSRTNCVFVGVCYAHDLMMLVIVTQGTLIFSISSRFWIPNHEDLFRSRLVAEFDLRGLALLRKVKSASGRCKISSISKNLRLLHRDQLSAKAIQLSSAKPHVGRVS